jgi:hypothetical protein
MKIESFEKGCTICGYDPVNLPDVSKLPAVHQKAVISAYKLFVISEASWKGDGLVIDWNSGSQLKWSGWFDMEKSKRNPSGFRFVVTISDGTFSSAASGSRLCYPSDEEAKYHLTQHIELYRNVMVLPAA